MTCPPASPSRTGTTPVFGSRAGAPRELRASGLGRFEYLRSYLHIDSFGEVSTVDWLLIPSQKLLTLAVGPILHHDLGLARSRARFRYL